MCTCYLEPGCAQSLLLFSPSPNVHTCIHNILTHSLPSSSSSHHSIIPPLPFYPHSLLHQASTREETSRMVRVCACLSSVFVPSRKKKPEAYQILISETDMWQSRIDYSVAYSIALVHSKHHITELPLGGTHTHFKDSLDIHPSEPHP